MSFTIPVLETARLILRGHRITDLDAELALWSDPAVVRYIGGKPSTREEAWARLQRYVGHWALAGHGFWHVRERATDRFVGETGMGDFQRALPADAAASFHGVPEAGWVLAPWCHGQGYATEAMTAVLAWTDAAHPRSVCMIDPDNAGSLRVAAKLGYRPLGATTYHGAAVLTFARG